MSIYTSIVTYKTSEQELTALLNCVVPSPVDKIYIIDNSPTDLLRRFGQFSPKIEYRFGHGNVGYGVAHNLAIRESINQGAKYHVVINPDILFNPGTIESLSQYMDEHSDVGQIMPKVVYPNGDIQYLCKLLPSPIDLIVRRFIPVKSYRERVNYRFEMRQSGYDKIMQVPYLSGCFMFLRTESLVKAGGFSDKYWMYCEDLDLCRRIGQEYKTIYYPFASIVHVHKKESYTNKKLLLQHIRSAIIYFNQWGWICDRERKIANKSAGYP